MVVSRVSFQLAFQSHGIQLLSLEKALLRLYLLPLQRTCQLSSAPLRANA